jgi:hypothetical protein
METLRKKLNKFKRFDELEELGRHLFQKDAEVTIFVSTVYSAVSNKLERSNHNKRKNPYF